MDYYNDNAATLFKRYRELSPDKVHAAWKKLIPGRPGQACDIGAGSGRDACWLAEQGWDVVAVEPATEMRKMGEKHSDSLRFGTGSITWLADKLPELSRLRTLDRRFQLILLSAVWMHLTPRQHARAMRIVGDLLAPGGILVIGLRHGPDKANRFHPVSADELIRHARNRALPLVHYKKAVPDLVREDITWDFVVFKLPDDGTGSLPLLRHIIVNDNKSSSYKLGLLRALIRIAESAPGMVIGRTDDYVEIPFGLVGLYWLKIYMPLVLKHNLVQTPGANHGNRTGYGWAGQSFYSLADLSPYDLRVGAGFDDEVAPRVRGAIRDACRNIKAMPVRHITYPGQDKQVFQCETSTVSSSGKHWRIDRETMRAFGSFRIPSGLWQSFGQYACWLEPALLNEWVGLMQGWTREYKLSIYDKALKWDEGKRDTSGVRNRVMALQKRGEKVSCVWTRTRLKEERYAVDHCFPWSRWFNNDLWNLMPTTERANLAKADKLPSALLLRQSKDNILQWWHDAYLDDDDLTRQFFLEAESALPLLKPDGKNIEQVFHAVRHQRTKLKASQQLEEWHAGMR